MDRITFSLFSFAVRRGAYTVLLLALTAIAAPAQTFTKLADFDWTNGAWPDAPLVQGLDGDFYGTTSSGGSGVGTYGGGTVFKLTPKGVLTTLYNFCSDGSQCADGYDPNTGLVQGPDGNFYGTTYFGGLQGQGTAFRTTTRGKPRTLINFKFRNPQTGLLVAADGSFYGISRPDAYCGGDYLGCGSVFRMAPRGKVLTYLYSFCTQEGCTDGAFPSGLIQTADGTLYGTAEGGGANGGGAGTVFALTAGGRLTTLYDFCAQADCTDGAYPGAPPLQGTGGRFYGTAVEGGAGTNSNCFNFNYAGCGTVYRLDVGLAPFVSALPYSGRVGASVKILGQGLTGTTAVSFNGTAAGFTVNSDTYLTATVPTGATTGFLTVTTPSGALTSNKKFQVLP